MKKIKLLTISAILIAIGIVIPVLMPIKIVLGPMSWTLFSHVPIFIACFISPVSAIAVGIGTAIGFQISGIFPPVVVARAASHLIFACILSIFWKRLSKQKFLVKNVITNFVIAIIHALCEAMVVMFIFPSAGNSAKVIWISVFLGTVIHSLFDFEVSYLLWSRIKNDK